MNPEPSDHTTMTAVLDAYGRGGFTGQFTVEDDAGVRCNTCGVVAAPTTVELHSLRRLEGASDPDDMAAVLAIVCPACRMKGTAVVMFGPQAHPGEVELLLQVQDRRTESDDVPGNAPDDQD